MSDFTFRIPLSLFSQLLLLVLMRSVLCTKESQAILRGSKSDACSCSLLRLLTLSYSHSLSVQQQCNGRISEKKNQEKKKTGPITHHRIGSWGAEWQVVSEWEGSFTLTHARTPLISMLFLWCQGRTSIISSACEGKWIFEENGEERLLADIFSFSCFLWCVFFSPSFHIFAPHQFLSDPYLLFLILFSRRTCGPLEIQAGNSSLASEQDYERTRKTSSLHSQYIDSERENYPSSSSCFQQHNPFSFEKRFNRIVPRQVLSLFPSFFHCISSSRTQTLGRIFKIQIT